MFHVRMNVVRNNEKKEEIPFEAKTSLQLKIIIIKRTEQLFSSQFFSLVMYTILK